MRMSHAGLYDGPLSHAGFYHKPLSFCFLKSLENLGCSEKEGDEDTQEAWLMQ